MNLHLDKDAFRVLIEEIHSKTGYRTDVLEKDYYVALIVTNGRKCLQTNGEFCPMIAGFYAGTYSVPA